MKRKKLRRRRKNRSSTSGLGRQCRFEELEQRQLLAVGEVELPISDYQVDGYDYKVYVGQSSVYGDELRHAGEDFGAPATTAVRSIADGTVRFSGPDPSTGDDGVGGYGHVSVIEHEWPDGMKYMSIYGHLSPNGLLPPGPVEVGGNIGFVGYRHQNGRSDEHLHFQIVQGAYSGNSYSEIGGWLNPERHAATYNDLTRPSNVIGQWSFGTAYDYHGAIGATNGWTAEHGLQMHSNTARTWLLNPDPGQSDPYVVSEPELRLNTNYINAVRASLRSSVPGDSSNRDLQLFYRLRLPDGTETDWSEPNSVWARNIPASESIAVGFDLSTNGLPPDSEIVQLRLDLATVGFDGDSDLVEIDWIRAYHSIGYCAASISATGTRSPCEPLVLPNVFVSSPDPVIEGDTAVFEIRLSEATTLDVQVDYATGSGGLTATPGEDYVRISGTTVIPAGKSSVTVAVSTIDDTLDEADETFGFFIANAVNANITGSEGGTSIRDNDEPSVVANVFVSSPDPVTEGETAVFEIRLSETTTLDMQVDYATGSGGLTATPGEDYVRTSGTAVIPAGQTSVTVAVPTIDDALDEPDETFGFFISNAVNANITGSEGGTSILDNDEASVVPNVFVASPDPVTEGDTAVFEIRLSEATTLDVQVDYTTGSGGLTATPDEDYVRTRGTAVIPAGQTSVTVAVPTIDDTLDEPDETFGFFISNAVNANITSSEGGTSILDNDEPPGFTVVESSGFTEVSESGSQDTLTVVLTLQPTFNVVIDVTSGDLSEVITSPATLTYTPANWNVAQSVTVTGVDDAITDGDPTTLVTLSINDAASDDVFDSVVDQTVNVITRDDELPQPGTQTFFVVDSSDNATFQYDASFGLVNSYGLSKHPLTSFRIG